MPFRPSDSFSKFTRSTRTKASRFVDRFSELVSSASEAAHQHGVRWGLDIDTIDYGSAGDSAEDSSRCYYGRMSSRSRKQLEDVSQFTPTPTKAPLSAFQTSNYPKYDDKYEEDEAGEVEVEEEKQAHQEAYSALDPPEHPWDLETPVKSVDPGGTSIYNPDRWRSGIVEDEVPLYSLDGDEDGDGWVHASSSQASSSLHSSPSNALQEVDPHFGVSSLASSFHDSASSQFDEAPSSPYFSPTAPQESQFIFPVPESIPPNSSKSHGTDSLSRPPSV